jgi:hypothetical protein
LKKEHFASVTSRLYLIFLKHQRFIVKVSFR